VTNFSIIFLPINSWKLILLILCQMKILKYNIIYGVLNIFVIAWKSKNAKKSHFGCHSKSFLKTWDFVIFLIFQNNCFVHKQISIQIFYPRFLYMKLFFYNNDYVFRFPGRKESKNERVNVHFFLSILLLYDTWTILLLVIFFSCGRKLNLDS